MLSNTKGKTVHVLRVGDYRPDLCKYTIPTIQLYADRIGAKLNVITERVFPEYPVTYEKLQIHKLGAEQGWNVLIDADTMVHPDLPDFTAALDPGMVGMMVGHDMRGLFKPNPYFLRCGHFQAIASNFVITSELTHDLWRPLEMPLAEALKQTLREFILDEYALTYNAAKYGLRMTGLLPPAGIDALIHHMGNAGKNDLERQSDTNGARKLFLDWGFSE